MSVCGPKQTSAEHLINPLLARSLQSSYARRMATTKDTVGEIARLAEQVASELLASSPALKSAQRIDRGPAITQAMHPGEGSAARLKRVVREERLFGDLRNGWIEMVDGFGMTLQEHTIPFLLINSAIDGFSVETVIADAQAFAKSRKCVTEHYTPLAGVTVTAPVSLGDDVDLIPWADVPNSDTKSKFGLNTPRRVRADSIPPFFITHAFATAAVRTRSAESQVLFASVEDAKAMRESLPNNSTFDSVRIKDVVRCITAESVCTVAEIGRWAQFDEKVANEFVGSGYIYNQALFDDTILAASKKPATMNGSAFTELFSCFEKLKPAERDVMRVALDRLGQAIRRPIIVDKAIDLGIALEVMLLHSIGDNDRGELKYRSSIRGATFLGGDKSKRLKTFKLLKEAYDLRSRAVHSGVLRAKKNGRPPEEILREATEACANIARILILRGSFPDWDTEYVIGEGK